ncbi:probable mitochondrial-processing peptidase subunit beta, mitochondrial [Ziziphus jujuba]|uniref:Probable mitochondrial-processing peptidase subunit beta, mitochondrial n=1 Tax=Ziziphus jujuba TaxID=326968 RepID=A0ABM3I089_ZIZJJ|nr:probable mitochondrial-processing peptidase subunit beta, mitochondrial [Ziziphus jujuba]
MAIIRHLTRTTLSLSLLSLSNGSTRSASSLLHRSPPPPQDPTLMQYDRLSNSINTKIKRLDHPDPRFLRYTSPHPTSSLDLTPILSSPRTRITTLPNGLRVATQSTQWDKTATVGVWVDAGSRFETDETNGVAHFLEHMILNGTKSRSGKALWEEVENMGGYLNAYTSREQTTYYVKVMGEEVPMALDILADMLQNSCMDEALIDQERGIILQEKEEVEMQAEEVIFDHLHATAFQYSPLGRTILGPVNNIKKITKADLQDYVSTHYAAHRMVICGVGAVRHEDIVEQVKKLFTKLSANPNTSLQWVANQPTIFTGSEVRIIDDDAPLAQFAIAFEGASYTDPDSIALMVMQTVLSSWDKTSGAGKHMGSELAQKVSINELAESMAAFSTNYSDTGLFGVYAVAKPDCLEDLSQAIMYQITKLIYRVSEVDVIRARNQLKSSMLLHLDGTTPVAEDIGRQLLKYGRRIPLTELMARIDAVDVDTVKHVANRFIFDKDMAIAAMGPIQGLQDYNWFRRRTYWLRY